MISRWSLCEEPAEVSTPSFSGKVADANHDLFSAMKSQLLVIVALVLFAFAALGLYLWRRTAAPVSVPPPATVAPTTVRAEGLDAYLTGSAWKDAHPGPVVFIGIDGGSWRFIDPLISVGELPNLERIKREGAFATLRSTPCYVSPPAWVAMFTGCYPQKTGIYTFGRPEPGAYLFIPVTAEDVRVPSVWDVASYAGRRVAVINVPVTYPVRPLNGIMISGIMTPNDAEPPLRLDIPRRQLLDRITDDPDIHSYSPIAKAAFGDTLNTLLLAAYDTVDDGRSEYDLVEITVLAHGVDGDGDHALGSCTTRIGEYSPWMKVRARRHGKVTNGWCKLVISSLVDQAWNFEVSPTVFEIEAPYIYPREFQSVLSDSFGYYMPSKLLEKSMVPAIAEEAAAEESFIRHREDWDLFQYVFTQSDNVHHVDGFGGPAVSVYETIDRAIGEVMKTLPDNGTLIIASDHGFEEYKYSIDLNQYLASLGLLHWQSPGVVDHANTLVYHNLWHLYFNRELMTPAGLRERGIEVGGGDVDSVLVAYLIDEGKKLRVPQGKFPLDFMPVTKGVGDPPDMLVRGTYPGYTVDFWNLKIPHKSIVRQSTGGDKWDHTREGVFLAWGRAVRKGYDAGTKDIVDVAPTMLYLMDLPVADYMDGTIMHDILTPAFVSTTPTLLVADYSPVSTKPLTENAERETLEKKLRSLGYIR
jgi:predicted AlkP superfamily phosphohydrolase/phosphomutase